MRVLRDPYSAKPYVLLYTTKRVGGGVQDFDAIKVMKFADPMQARRVIRGALCSQSISSAPAAPGLEGNHDRASRPCGHGSSHTA